MSCGFDNRDVIGGLILGTGTNACYMEKLDNIEKWTGDDFDPREVIINTEWGAFGDNGVLDWLMTEQDKRVDAESINPGQQLYVHILSSQLYKSKQKVLILNDFKT